MINLDLLQQGYPPINVKFADRKRYYACFDSYFRDQDPVPLIRLFGEAVDEQLDRYLTMLSDTAAGSKDERKN